MRPSSLHDRLQAILGDAFRLDRELNGGGMSRVFLAREVALGRDVVVKVLPPELVSTLSLGRFRREIEVTAQLQHPHVLPILTSGGEGELLYYITPYIKGRSLRTRLDEGPLPLAEALGLLRELLGATAFAHGNGVVHRDIKPGNVLLAEGHAILADFGIARLLEERDPSAAEPPAGSVTGTPGYIAPEGPRDSTADLYALGALLHEMIGQGTPTAGSTPGTVLAGLRAARPELSVRVLRPVAGLIATATAHDPGARFPSAHAFRDSLDRVAGRTRTPRALIVALAVAASVAVALAARETSRSPAVEVPTPNRPELLTSEPFTLGDSAVPDRPAAPRSLLDSAARFTRRGRIDRAIPLLRELTSAEPDHAAGWFALATVLTWSSLPAHVGEARAAATRAVELRHALPRRDALVAAGLLAQNEGRYPAACAAFDSARAIRADFIAWFGAAECRRRDDRIEVVDGVARFRGDPVLAAAYYEESWRRRDLIAPTLLHARLQEVLPPQPGRVRRGSTAEGTTWFGTPTAVGDSVRWELHPAGPRRLTPEGIEAARRATRIARDRLRPLLIAWVATDPRDPDGHAALADLLELDGVIASAGSDGFSALGEARLAVRTAVAAEDSLQRMRDLVRLLLRDRSWTEAADLADSLVSANPRPENVAAEFLVGLAALTGRLGTATTLARQQGGMPQRQVRGTDGAEVPLPTAISNDRIAFGLRAAAGVCDDEQRRAPARLLDALDAVSPPATRPRGLEAAYLERTLMLALDCVDPAWTDRLSNPALPPNQVARAILTGDTIRARGLLAALDGARQRGGPVPPTADQAVGEALARLLLADSGGARRALAAALDALPLAPAQFLHNEHPAAALPRAMLLKAELDAAAGDLAAARQLARAVTILWREADPLLDPALVRARALAGTTP